MRQIACVLYSQSSPLLKLLHSFGPMTQKKAMTSIQLCEAMMTPGEVDYTD